MDVSEIERLSTVSENSTLENMHQYVTLKIFGVEMDDLFHRDFFNCYLLAWRKSETFQTNTVGVISKTHI